MENDFERGADSPRRDASESGRFENRERSAGLTARTDFTEEQFEPAETFRQAYARIREDIYSELSGKRPNKAGSLALKPGEIQTTKEASFFDISGKTERLNFPATDFSTVATARKAAEDSDRLHLEYPSGDKTRDILFDKNDEAIEIISKDDSGTVRLVNKDGKWFAKLQDLELPVPGTIEAKRNGDVSFQLSAVHIRTEKSDGSTISEKSNADGSQVSFNAENQIIKLSRKDGSREIKAGLGSDMSGAEVSADVEEAKENLLDLMRDKLPEINQKRLEEMMQKFEERMSDRAELRKLAAFKSEAEIDADLQKELKLTYDSLSEMVSKDDGGSFFDRNTRVKLAENFIYHAMEPTSIDQGPASQSDWNGHGTCWISAGQIWGMTNRPGEMADYLKQVTLNGEFTSKNSGKDDPTIRNYRFSENLLSFDGKKQESRWTIETATKEWRDDINSKTMIMGDRSPVSKIFDYTLPLLAGPRKEFDVDGGIFRTANIVGQGLTRGTQDIMYMVTGDAPVDMPTPQYSDGSLVNGDFYRSMAEKGAVHNYGPGHSRSQTVRKVDGKWYLIQDDQHSEQSDKVLGEIKDIKRWVHGDKSVQIPVNISAINLLHRKIYMGSGSADALGIAIPHGQKSGVTNQVASIQQNTYASAPARVYSLPALEISR